MGPIDAVLGRLRGVRRSGEGWVACCPAHDDEHASLSVGVQEDGRVLLHCFAGCDVVDVVAAMGLGMRDLFPKPSASAGLARRDRRDGARRGKGERAAVEAGGRGLFEGGLSARPRISPNGKVADGVRKGEAVMSEGNGMGEGVEEVMAEVYGTAREALAAAQARMAKAKVKWRYAGYWVYTDAAGEPVGLVARWDREGGKTIRPISRREGGWVIGAMPEPRPLYRLPEVLAGADAGGQGLPSVVLVEGEKCVEAVRGLKLPGLVATTSSGGASAWAKTDWGPLRGRSVYILADADEPGRAYADGVGRHLLGLGCTVRVCYRLPGVPEGGDVVDWLALQSTTETADAVKELGFRLMDLLDTETRPLEPEPMGATGTDGVSGVAGTAASGSEGAAGEDGAGSGVGSGEGGSAEVGETAGGTVPPAVSPTPSAAPVSGQAGQAGLPSIISFARIQRRNVRWLWPKRLAAGKVTLLAGRPGCGKSYLTCDWAARLSRGADWPDGERGEVGDTLMVCSEDDPSDTLLPRLEASAAVLERVHCLVAPAAAATRTLADIAGVIQSAAQRMPDLRLVVIDPISTYLGGVDTYRDVEVRESLLPLAEAIATTDLACLLVTHTRKGGASTGQTDLDDAVLGSRGFVGLSRMVIHAVPDEDAQRLVSGKANICAPASELRYRVTDGGVEYLTGELDGASGEDAEELRLLDELFGHRLEATADELRDAAEASGLGWARVRGLLERLGLRPTRRAGGWVYIRRG